MACVAPCMFYYTLQHNILICFSPIVPGHEIIGEVAAVGDDVSQWHIGDRIGGAWHGGHDGSFDCLSG
jgi:D-arabinose 1-dehydrogenase-like Zn-dependent alcohol dehydrogenase